MDCGFALVDCRFAIREVPLIVAVRMSVLDGANSNAAKRNFIRARGQEANVNGAPSSIMYQKLNELTVNFGSLAKIQVIECKRVARFPMATRRKTRGEENEGMFHYVIENTCKKMSDAGVSTMLMKTQGL